MGRREMQRPFYFLFRSACVKVILSTPSCPCQAHIKSVPETFLILSEVGTCINKQKRFFSEPLLSNALINPFYNDSS